MPRPIFPQITPRKAALALHLWLGLSIGLYFVIAGLTGSILAFQEQLSAFDLPETVRVAAPYPGAKPLPLARVMAVASAELPGHEATMLVMPYRRGGAYRVFGIGPDKEIASITTIDPYTGHLLRTVAYTHTLVGFARTLHVSLFRGAAGEVFVGDLALSVPLLLLTGLWLWWPVSAKQIRSRFTIKWRAGPKRAVHDLHSALGIYALPALLTMALTGFFIASPDAVLKLLHTAPAVSAAKKTPLSTAAESPTTPKLSPDTLLAIAEKTAPGGPILSFNDPAPLRAPFSCFKLCAKLGFLRYAQFMIDPYTGKVLSVQDERRAPIGARLPRIINQLHQGLWGGPVIQACYSLIGLMPLTLFVTGVMMYARKRRDKAKALISRRNREISLPNEEKTPAMGGRLI